MIKREQHKLVIIGGGVAGIAAALKAEELGIKNTLLLEREPKLTKSLNNTVTTRVDSTVLNVTPNKETTVQSPEGIFKIQAEAIIFATGSREKHRGSIALAGPRVSGIMTLGMAQQFLDTEACLLGKNIVILGLNEKSLNITRRLRSKEVLGVYGLPLSTIDNKIVESFKELDVPVFLSKTVLQVHGKARLEGITIVDFHNDTIHQGHYRRDTEQEITCDTLLLSLGAVPSVAMMEQMGVVIDPSSQGAKVNKNMETSIPGVFACGDCCHVQDSIDKTVQEGEQAAMGVATFFKLWSL
ncbi:MAG: NAD(P)/FAD-dependent oxidoreductase [Brevinema sp.]